MPLEFSTAVCFSSSVCNLVFGYDNINSGFCSLVTTTGSWQCETSQEEHSSIKLAATNVQVCSKYVTDICLHVLLYK